jgi:hypothetical protein
MSARYLLAAWAGLLVAPLVWAISTQLGEILPYVDCGAKVKTSAVISISAAVIAAVAGFGSWRAGQSLPGERRLLRFIGGVSGLSGVLLAFATAMQAAAALVLSACQR